ncbi:DinB family protein [Kocuria sp.]|uniref:DinB family protein n=1 Tax=Kocuria sp. TaxID=1871328 RepID=UPI0026DB8AF7|nr:DinB family protein [Kocuria sp.]MDO4918110.1 DinB family protein [Kocuria sp.]
MTSPSVDEHGRPEPPQRGDEVTTLFGFLEHLRATIAWKTDGLSTAQLHSRPLSSTMSLGGMLKHLAYVEDHWFRHVLSGREPASPWDAVEWQEDPDWDWDSALEDDAADLRALWSTAVDASRQQWGLFAAEHANPLDAPVERPVRGDMSARWVLTHMVEEYARHCGHADLLREAIDGATGE